MINCKFTISSLILPHQRFNHCFLPLCNVSANLQSYSLTRRGAFHTSRHVYWFWSDVFRRSSCQYALRSSLSFPRSPPAVTWDPGTDVIRGAQLVQTVTGWNILNKHVFSAWNQRPGLGVFCATFVRFSCWPAPEGQIATLCSCDSMFTSFTRASALRTERALQFRYLRTWRLLRPSRNQVSLFAVSGSQR